MQKLGLALGITSALLMSAASMAKTQYEDGASVQLATTAASLDNTDYSLGADGVRFPSILLKLSERISVVLWVELEAGRLHMLRRREQGDGWDFVLSRPVSIGKAGSGKQYEGDNKTPIGIYSVSDLIADEDLIDFYGFGAFPLSYPNNWDRRLGRTGYGIWLHGLPKTVQSRPRLDSEGCVVIDNKTLHWIATAIDPQRTRVVLGPELTWSDTDNTLGLQKQIGKHFADWLAAWSANDTAAYLNFYHPTFSDGKKNLDQWRAYKTRINAAKNWIDVAASDVSIFSYPGESDLLAVEYRQRYRSSNYNHNGRKTVFWQRVDDNQWQIVYEGSGQL